MATYPLNFLGFMFLLLFNFLLISTEAFPSYYYLSEDDASVDPSLSDIEEISQFPISLHGYGIRNGKDTDISLANQIKDKLLRLRLPVPHTPMKRNQAWAQGYGKRQQAVYATHVNRDFRLPHTPVERIMSSLFQKRQHGWNIGYGRK